MIDNAVKALVDVVEHVHDFHRCAVLAQSGETDNVAKIYCHFLVQLWLHNTGLLQAFHHRATQREKRTETKQDDVSDESTFHHSLLLTNYFNIYPLLLSITLTNIPSLCKR